MSRFVSPIWGEDSNKFDKHTSLNSCSDYLPKPKRKFENILCQCSKCGKIYVGAIVPPTGTPFWKSLKLIEGEQK